MPLAKKNAGDRKDNPNCVGENVSPPLVWANPSAGTKSFALTMVDPEGRGGLGVVHWVLYGIPVTVTGFAEGEVSKPSPNYVGGKGNERSRDLFGAMHPSGSAAPLYVHVDRHRAGAGRSAGRPHAGGTFCKINRPHQGSDGPRRSIWKSISGKPSQRSSMRAVLR